MDGDSFNGSYEKMSDSLKKLGLDEIQMMELEKVKWVVTEKIHGANFSLIYEGGTLSFAKRKNLLSWNESFFGFQLVVERMEENVLQLFEALRLEYPAGKLIIHGELFGGKYPHPEVKPAENMQPVQTGVWYSPEICFWAFDLAIIPAGTDEKTYLDYETAIRYFQQFGIPYAQPLFTGKLNETLNFQTRIDSTIPQALGLPPISGNLIEGVVVKPFEAYNSAKVKTRPILKIKNEEFKEDKFHEAQQWDYHHDTAFRSQELSFVVEELKHYITENRLNSAISKIGMPEAGNVARTLEIEEEMLQDCFTDFNLNTNQLLQLFDEGQKAWITNRIRAEIKWLMNDFVKSL